jgi:hypothetical protein
MILLTKRRTVALTEQYYAHLHSALAAEEECYIEITPSMTQML